MYQVDSSYYSEDLSFHQQPHLYNFHVIEYGNATWGHVAFLTSKTLKRSSVEPLGFQNISYTERIYI